jgi:hypothetical protein
MKLIGTIKNILMEESKRDLTSVIQTLLDGFVNDHKDILCKVEVKHPDNRTKLPHSDNNYENYRATFYLIGGYGSSNWPATQAVMVKFDNLMNEAWDLVYNYTGQKLDMFTKHVKSCDDIIKESKENSIPNMIKTLGISDAIKYFGNYYTIEPYLKEIDKVNFIKEKVNGLTEWIGGGVGLVEIDEEPIHYNEDENEIKQIEYLGKNSVTVDVYDADMNRHLGDFNVQYESLPSQIIEELVEILLNH